jgi:fatty-acyl-CoA synthase
MANDQGLGFTLSRRAQLNPDNTALIFRDERWTYAELNRLTNKVAQGLHAQGVNPGDRVGFLGLNHPRFFFTLFAAAKLDAIFVPLNFRLTGPELSFIIRDAGLHTLVYEEAFAAIVDSIRGDVSVREYVCAVEQSGARGFESLLHDQRDSDLDYPVAMSDVALIMYTSGTTGRPKGAMLTHGNIIWNNINALLADDATSEEITLVVAPLFHIGGLNVTPLLAFLKGATVVMEQMFEPGMVLENIEKYRVTSMFGVPAMYLFMAQHPDFATRDLSTIRVLSCGGAPVPEALIKIYAARGLPFNQGYGLTETAPFASFLPSSMATEKLGSAGIAPFFTDVKIVDDDGREVPDGERGEIVVRGPNVMKGYWNRPDATAEVLIDGWFHTGDVGIRDADGYFFIVDRKKDMIISGGENVYPAEVEDALYQHPAVKEVAVIGVQHPSWGETVRAVVVRKDGASLTEQELIEFTQDKLARYKQPKSVVFVNVLPRNPAGKVLKFDLREKHGQPMVESDAPAPQERATTNAS